MYNFWRNKKNYIQKLYTNVEIPSLADSIIKLSDS